MALEPTTLLGKDFHFELSKSSEDQSTGHQNNMNTGVLSAHYSYGKSHLIRHTTNIQLTDILVCYLNGI